MTHIHNYTFPKPPGPWVRREDLACKGSDPDLFFGDGRAGYGAVRQAQAICADCPGKAICRDYALGQNPQLLYGVWGGTTRDERLKLAGRSKSKGKRKPERTAVAAGGQ